ncbi:MAG: hypothetical protein F6K28_13230 [Microcoleus sp. SIO2G3]|nr:hypothetical protein [Microcoleus sp. SIO2G3]
MESLAFATLLFIVYFCAACCFCYSPKNSNLTTTDSVSLEATEDEDLVQDLWEADEPITLAQALSAEFDPQPVVEEAPESPNQQPTLEQLLTDIDLDTLQLRPARKICSRLGIQQKVNGKDAPLTWLRSQIKSRLSEKPTEVAPIIQEILEAA